jgi:hypothetical protein
MSSAPSVSALRACIETTARALLSGYEEGSSQQDASIINRDVTSECRRFLLPASVPAAFGLPADFYFDNVKYQETFANDIKRLAFKSNVMSNLVIDTEARRAAFTSIADVETQAGEKYQAEMAWTLYFNDDGSKIVKVVEFCDKDVILRMASAGE